MLEIYKKSLRGPPGVTLKFYLGFFLVSLLSFEVLQDCFPEYVLE